MNHYLPVFQRLCRRWRRVLASATGALVLVTVAISCRSVNRSVVLLPDVPGAKYIGSKECEQCHDKIYRDFATADHARLMAEGPNALNAGCESCHGPGSLHSESGGEVKPAFAFGSGRPAAGSFRARLAVDPQRSKEKFCFQCHSDVMAHFSLPIHQQVPQLRLIRTH